MVRILWLVVLVNVVQCLPMSRDELEDFSNFLLKTSSLDLHVKKGVDPDESFDEDEVTSDHAWEESGKFEGDLILNDRQRRLIVENVEGLSRNGLTDSTKRWPNNEVIYFIQREHFTSGQVQAIQDGIDDLGRASCVKFRPYRKGDRDAVVIQGSRRGCFSQVGYQGGYQVLNLSGRHPVGRGCFRHGTVVHEMLHTLGFYHMQSSPDRDDYIDVIWANIVQPARHNFRKYNSFSVSDYGVGYDYDSVLHYSRRAFSANGQDTLVPKKRGAVIGQRVGLSDKDTQKLNKMYCDADNDPVQPDENAAQKPKNKNKKPKNQPFQGHGIGYHQGKTVVIKLPAAQNIKLPNVPSIHVFDFSRTPQIVSTTEAEDYRFGEIVNGHKPITSLNTETVTDYENGYEAQTFLNKNTQKQYPDTDHKVESLKEDKHEPQHSNEVKPEYVHIDEHDKDLKDASRRLTKIDKKHVYPQNQGYSHKISKDYSKFYIPHELKKSDSLFEPISYGSPTSTSQKQIDTKLDENSGENLKNSKREDIMDTSYRTSLPTQRPYSSYEQTETPPYATLQYLKNRHDFSKLYSPHGNKHRDNNHPTERDKYIKDIKINPYEQGFYTDYVKLSLKDASRLNTSKATKPSKYERDKSPNDKRSDSTNKQLEIRMDSSYRTLLHTKKPYSAYDHTETPNYATLEYLKDRHAISNLYPPKISAEEKRKESHIVLGDELPPTESNWYKQDSIYKHNPANYDRESYASYTGSNCNRKNVTETLACITDASKYHEKYDDEVGKESSKKIQGEDKAEMYDPDFYRDHEKEVNEYLPDYSKFYENENKGESPNEKQTIHYREDYDHGYHADYEKAHSDHLTEASNIDDEEVKESSEKII